DPRVQLATERTAREILVAFVGRRLHDGPFEPYLAAELLPVEHGRRPWVPLELTALAGAVVRVEHDVAAFLGHALQQHHAYAGPAVLADGRERDRVRVTAGAGRRLVEPTANEDEGRVALAFGHRRRLGRCAQASAFA